MNIHEQMEMIAKNNRNTDIYNLYNEVQRGELGEETLLEVIERELEFISTEQ